jgi:hypothetical protein
MTASVDQSAPSRRSLGKLVLPQATIDRYGEDTIRRLYGVAPTTQIIAREDEPQS